MELRPEWQREMAEVARWIKERFYTTREAAAILGVTNTSVGHLCKQRKIPAVMVGTVWMIPRGAVEAYREEPKLVGGRPPREYLEGGDDD